MDGTNQFLNRTDVNLSSENANLSQGSVARPCEKGNEFHAP